MTRLLTILILLLALPVMATNYYVDNGGSDAAAGTVGVPWQHVAYALSNAPNGSTIYLTSGQMFTEDGMVMTNRQNILLTSSGSTPAILRNATTTFSTNVFSATLSPSYYGYGVGKDVLAIYNSSGITLSNLCLGGNTPNVSNLWACVQFVSDNGGYVTNETVVNCETTNTTVGVFFYGTLNTPSNLYGGFKVINNKIHEHGWMGVGAMYNGVGNPYPIAGGVVTANNEIYNIRGLPWFYAGSGHGIVMFGVNGWECYSNYIHDCGQWQTNMAFGGAGGLFPVYYSKNVHVWNNEIARIYACPGNGDGCGIDMDLTTSYALIEGNFVHDCGGAGYTSISSSGNNTWRWNVGINDGNGLCNTNYVNTGRSPEFWINDGADLLSTNSYNYIYNNTLIGNWSAVAVANNYLVPNTGLILNNIFGQLNYKDGNGNPIALVVAYPPYNDYPAVSTHWYFAGNAYLIQNTNTYHFFINWNTNNNYFSLIDWRAAGQETNGTGYVLDVNAGGAGFTGGTGTIASNYYLLSSSVLLNAGMDVTAYGLSKGTMDFYTSFSSPPTVNIGGLQGTNSAYVPPPIYSVTNYGAKGDLVWAYVNVTNNSIMAVSTNTIANGATLVLFNCGPLGTGTTNQDFLCVITNVVNGTNLYLNVKPSVTMRAYGYSGTNNAASFQAAINAAPSNTVIHVPSGNYLIIGASNFMSFSMSTAFDSYPSITLWGGGLTLQGEGRDTTILTGCGAWQNKGIYGYRGYMFSVGDLNATPVNNVAPVVFSDMTFDGGVAIGRQGTYDDSLLPADGSGWDTTHDAIVQGNEAPALQMAIYTCTFMRWRGEMVKGLPHYDVPTGVQLVVSNTIFHGGNGSAVGSWPASLDMNGCFAYDIRFLLENAMQTVTNLTLVRNCIVSNAAAGIALTGANNESPCPLTFIYNNKFLGIDVIGINVQNARNVCISNNWFDANVFSVDFGPTGAQGTSSNYNATVIGNVFTNFYYGIVVDSSTRNYNITVTNNLFTTINGGGRICYAGYGWGTNILFVNNSAVNAAGAYVDSEVTLFQYMTDRNNTNFWQYPNQNNHTNVAYFHGQNQKLYVGSSFYCDDSSPAKIPLDVTMNVTNTSGGTVSLYQNLAGSGSPMVLNAGQGTTVAWSGSAWTNSAFVPPPQAPSFNSVPWPHGPVRQQ